MDDEIRKRYEWLCRNTTKEELDTFWERFPDTSNDWGPETKSVRDVQIMLACGRWLEAYFEGWHGYLDSDSGPYVRAWKDGEHLTYVADDLDEFGRDATFGPYPLADVIGKWSLGEE